MIPDCAYYKYWGKAKKNEDGAFDCHLLLLEPLKIVCRTGH